MKPSWLDDAPLPSGIVRSQRCVYANRALLALLGARWEDLEGRLFLEHVAPEDRERVGDRYARRVRGEPVPDNYEIDLVRSDGTRRRVEVWATRLDDDHAMFQLSDRTDRARHQEHLTALARLGASVQLEHTEDAVFATVARGLASLGVAMVRLAPVGELGESMRIVALTAPGDLAERFFEAAGEQIDYPGLWGPGAEGAWRDGGAYLDDMPLAATRFFRGEAKPAEAAGAITRGAMLARGVMLRVDADGSPHELLLLMAEWLLPEDLPACRLFAAQVSAALDAARALRAEKGRNAALTAQTRIASIARTAGDLDLLFSRGAVEVAAVLGCDGMCIHLVDEARGEAVLANTPGVPKYAHERVRLAGSPMGTVVQTAAPLVLRAEDRDPEAVAVLDRLGYRVLVAVPLSTRGKVIAVMSAGYYTEHTASVAEVELMEAAGAHFAAAVEAQRLFADLRKSYADLARAQEQLVQRERLAAIGELSAVVAHEVRNPLGVLFNSLGSLRKLLADDAQGAARTLLDIMEEEAARLNHIVRDLLDFARPTHPTFHKERLDAVLEEAVEAALAESAQPIEVVRDLADLPLVPIDARLVRQALLNVATNAVQAMPTGGRVTLRLAREDADGVPMAKVAIEDTGPGIPPDVAARIFEPFFTTRATGTGLGLAVVKRIVDGHRGRVRVDGASGRGTTFTLWLPLEEPA